MLVAPLGDDEASQTVLALLEPHVTVVRLPLAGTLPEKTRFRTGGRTLLRADRGDGRPGSGGAGLAGLVTDAAADAIAAAGAILVSDYGRGVTADPQLRSLLERQAGRVPLVWDPHPKGAPPVPRTRLVTPNLAEALAARPGCRGLRWGRRPAAAVAAARELGPALVGRRGGRDPGRTRRGPGPGRHRPLVVPAPPVAATDPCGAGDRFAAAAATALQRGALASEAVTSAVASASAYLARPAG